MLQSERMTLTEYRRKRNFSRISEPRPAVHQDDKTLIFVVQKHLASHLHYDFRLEMEGVLKSWAVPKGPSLDPSVKRLAMEVEDHPYDYKEFEGTIPEGNYGAGKVIVWDTGIYASEKMRDGSKELLRDLHRGKLSIVLLGRKLKGAFSLVRTPREDKEGNRRQWLLIKKDDQYASDADITKDDSSVLSDTHLPDPDRRG